MLTPAEGVKMKSELDAVVNRFTTASPTPGPTPGPTPTPPPTPGPTPGGWEHLEWNADGSNSRSGVMRSPCRAYFTVPNNAKSGAGRVVATSTGSSEKNFKSMVLSATPGGPPLAVWANVPSAKEPPITFYVGEAPHEFYNPPLSRGATYYVTIDNNPPMPAETNTNIVIDLDVPN